MIAYPIDSHVSFNEDGIPEYDRAVTSETLRKLLRSLFNTGIDPSISNNLQVAADEGMNVIVRPGFAMVDGCMALEPDTRVLAVQAASTEYDRIDTVVLRLNDNDAIRECDLYVVQGLPSSTPVHPDLTRSGAIYEIGLADIFVGKNSSRILASKITDTRFDSSRCGVMSSISEFDSSTIYQQVQADLAGFKTEEQAEFLSWFENIRNIIDQDAAGHLQLEIDELSEAVGDTDISDIGDGTVKSAITKLNNDLTANSKQFKFEYDTTKNKYGYVIDGTFHPFSSGAVHLGRYSANTTINVANLGATSKDQFLVVGHGGSWQAFSNPGSANITSSGGYNEATWSLSGNTLTVTAPTVAGGHSCAGGAAYSGPHACSYDVYFVGDIEEV